MPTEFVKVQRPIVSSISAEGEPWLIYDRARKHVQQLPSNLVPRHVREAMGSSYKAYFRGAWSSIVGWGLSNRSPP